MPKIGDLVTKLQINNKTFNKPEWWSTGHKLKKNIKNSELIKSKSKIDLKTSYFVNKSNENTYDSFTKSVYGKLDFPQYNEFAPWNPIFKKNNTIILFKKD